MSQLSDIRADDPAAWDVALALAKWASGTISTWIPALRRLSRTAVKYPESSAATKFICITLVWVSFNNLTELIA